MDRNAILAVHIKWCIHCGQRCICTTKMLLKPGSSSTRHEGLGKVLKGLHHLNGSHGSCLLSRKELKMDVCRLNEGGSHCRLSRWPALAFMPFLGRRRRSQGIEQGGVSLRHSTSNKCSFPVNYQSHYKPCLPEATTYSQCSKPSQFSIFSQNNAFLAREGFSGSIASGNMK